MTKRTWLVVGGVLAVVVAAACGVENVEAKDYRQGCSKDADCMLVDQIIDSPGSNACTEPCLKGAINKEDQDKYSEEFTQEHGDCSKVHTDNSCGTNQVAVCNKGTCTAGFSLADGGVDIPDASTD